MKWGSTSIIRIGYVGDANPPIILWIGIWPNTLSTIEGSAIALACKAVLVEHGIEEADVEICESIATRSAGPKLLEPSLTSDPAAEFRICLTPALGLSISNAATPWAEGTGGFFIASGSADSKVLLVTARHVVFDPKTDNNKLFERENVSTPRQDVVLLGDEAYKSLVRSIMVEIEKKGMDIQSFNKRLEGVEGREGPRFDRERTQVKGGITAAEQAIEELTKLHEEVKRWEKLEDRVIGHIVYAPPITVGADPDNFTEDLALVKIDASKFDASNVETNCIDLGTKIDDPELTAMMCPNPTSPYTFDYPTDRLLPLRDTIPFEEMRKPTTLDQNGDHCITVLKRGRTSGLTVGRANGIDSYVRYYDSVSVPPETSREWTIISYDGDSGAFSRKGDSGSVVVDGRGHIGGLLTGGDGATERSDLSYVTSIDFLLKHIKAWEGASLAHLSPKLYQTTPSTG